MPSGITVVGLGPGDPGQITREAWDLLSRAAEVYVQGDTLTGLAAVPEGPTVHSLDDLSQTGEPDAAVHPAIAQQLVELGRRDAGVVYAVPGDPSLGAAFIRDLREAARTAGLPLRLVHGVSLVGASLRLAERDGLDGLFLADALDLAQRHHPPFPPDVPALVGRLDSRERASAVMACLLNQYPGDHPVLILHNPGAQDQHAESILLEDLGQAPDVSQRTVLLVEPAAAGTSFESFQETVAHLRAPEGCPWDREQTHLSLRPHLLEESFEALDALDRQDQEALREELGDLLLQLVIQGQIATESHEFQLSDIIAGINAKLIRRHPHVFGDLKVAGVSEVLHNWEALKAEERRSSGNSKGSLDGVPGSLPALAQALEYQARAARVGFDWPGVEGVLDKIAEEVREVQAESTPEARGSELGDLLFALVNLARWMEIDPEAALREANRRFKTRFGRVEAAAAAQGATLNDKTLDELNALWDAAKKETR